MMATPNEMRVCFAEFGKAIGKNPTPRSLQGGTFPPTPERVACGILGFG